MADAGKNAITTHTGDDTTVTFAIGFSYLEPEDIAVTVEAAAQTLNTDYEIDSDGLNITFIGTSVPANGETIVFTRRTKRSGVAGDPVGSPPILVVSPRNAVVLRDTDIERIATQALYYTEEVEDKT